ncbi:MAG: hypothetical protein CMJ33_02280 [Phycisphaerae bacterium]|nr:hypothetical protein [Phycisphaerae bacterium]HAW95334.1 hypothetical protein [Phycisphaerales bacterium]
MPRLLACNLCVIILAVLSRSVLASEPLRLPFDGVGLSLALLDDEVAASPGSNDLIPDDEVLENARTAAAYATQDSTAWWFEVGGGSNFDGGWGAIGGVGVEWYPVDGFALGARFDGIGVGLKDTSTTGGVDAALLIRWHVLRRETWSVYFDGGCGFAVFADEVPTGASRFCFTPQLGLGVTCEVAEEARLMVGARWFHISNGQSASRNPGVDMLELYVGMTFSY